MKKYISKIPVALILIFTIMSNIVITYATSTTDLKNQQSQIDNKIKETEKKQDEVEEKMSQVRKEISALNADISDYETQISDLESDIKDLENSIKENEEKLKEAQKQYDEQKIAYEDRIIAQYEAGETTFLDLLLSSTSLVDFISNYYLVEEIAECDKEMLDEIEENKKQIEIAKQSLEKDKEQVEAAKSSKEKAANSLKQTKATKDKYVSELSAEEKELQEQLDQFEADKKAITDRLAEIARKEQEQAAQNGQSYVPVKPSSSGYIFPVAGLSKANINNKNYPSYPGHTGIDVNINVTGKSVVAVKSGTVVTSKALKNSNGTYRSYGEYIIINHHDGTMTLYAHGLANSRRVVEGQKVSQGQVLMTVGSTGNSTGTHLHFEVRVNGRCVNPLPYLP